MILVNIDCKSPEAKRRQTELWFSSKLKQSSAHIR